MARYLGLKKEVTYGTPLAPDVFVRILSENIRYNPNNQYSRTIEGGRKLQSVQSVQGLSEGAISLLPTYDKGLGELLNMLLGKVTTNVLEAATSWTHVFEPLDQITDSIAMPSYTIEKGLDAITAERYGGSSVGSAKISANPADFVKIDAQVFGKKPTSETLAVSPSFSSQDYLHAGQVTTQTLGGVITKFEEFSIDIIGGAVPVYRPGSIQPDSIDLDPLDVKVNFKTRFLSAADLTDFLNATKKALVYKWTGPVLGANNYSLQLDLPNLSFDEGDMEINEQNRLVQAKGATAIADGSDDVIKATLVNNVSAY